MAASPSADGLSEAVATARLAQYGYNEVEDAPRHPFREFLARFWGPVPWMLEAATGLELLLGKLPETAIIAGLLVFNAVLGEIQDARAQTALDLLRARLHVTARVRRDGGWRSLPARELVPGDWIHVRMGDIVPADCTVGEGSVEVDQSALTGESATVTRAKPETVYSGSIVRRGEASGTVTATGGHSYFGRTAELVRTAKSSGHLERLLFTIVRYLVTIDSVLAVTVLAVALYRGVPLLSFIPFVLILLIASVPVALPATFTVANAIEARELAEEGVLVTGLSAIQEAASVDVVCVDKTGTLTQNREVVGDILPFGTTSNEELLAFAGAACDESTQDPIDLAILGAMRERHASPLPRQRFVPFDPATKRSEAEVRSGDRVLRVVLGSPLVVGQLAGLPAGSQEQIDRLAASGARILSVAAGSGGSLSVLGLVALADPPREDAAELVRSLHDLGVRVLMLTGDTAATARAVGRQVGIGDRIGDRTVATEDPLQYDGFAGVYPEDKFDLVRALQRAGKVVGMTGDGVNDAPALKQAEVGVAVASATDVAKSAAKLVLTRPGLRDLVSAVTGGRRVYRRMLTWTITKISKNIEFVLLLSIVFIATGLFATTPFLIILLIFSNDFVTITVGTDRARISSVPDRWNVREIVTVAAFLGSAWLVLSLTVFWLGWVVLGLPLAEVQTLVFVYLVFSSQATVYIARVRGPFWSYRPSEHLVVASVGVGLAVSGLAISGTLMAAIPAVLVLEVLGIVAGAALVVDRVKIWAFGWTGLLGRVTPSPSPAPATSDRRPSP
ncbi:MAG TPA: plasma-membrane proton-efflux P-type ATPase [Thermoplasmata archaeon]|nr:plasma-membrane proton-efflux P-type ATPase [Thermoplasmata archaeon]